MKVLLKEDVDNIGYAGEVHKVADGYGRNYLIPQGMAVVATPGTMKQAEVWRKKAETRRAEQRAEFEALAAQITEVELTFTARAGETGKLYGSVTTAMIADALNEALGTEIDRRKVGVEPLRQLGDHKVVVRLSNEFQPELTVFIESEEEEEVFVIEAEETDEVEVEDGELIETEVEELIEVEDGELIETEVEELIEAEDGELIETEAEEIVELVEDDEAEA